MLCHASIRQRPDRQTARECRILVSLRFVFLVEPSFRNLVLLSESGSSRRKREGFFVMSEGRMKEEMQEVTLLGNQGTQYKFGYAPEILESFDNKHPGRDYFVKFNCPEFTSLCPVTGQPDFGVMYISYIPDIKMVESKSLKLYLFSFRNHGDFHEDCVNIIMNDLISLMNPRYIEVWGKFTPRGGISIDPYCNWGRPGTKYEAMAEHRLMNHDMYPEKVDNR
jgi:7-cyano-7-deazaguanine reductase